MTPDKLMRCPTPLRLQKWRLLTGMLVFFMAGLWLPLATPSGTVAPHVIEHATLQSLTGTREVSLPHILSGDDFSTAGSFVRYRLTWQVDEPSQAPQAAFVSKLSLSGRLYVNSQLIGDCGNGPLEELRCLHQPHLFRIPAALLRVGENTLEFEILATPRQMNGLSAVEIGDVHTLHESRYVWAHFLSNELQIGLIWLSVLLGLLSLTVGVILKNESVFIWFGLTSIINALASLNGVVVHPRIDIDVYNWIVFWSRLVSVPLAFLTLLAVFGKDGRRITALLAGYGLLLPLIIWLSGNSRMVTFSLYVPLVLSCPYLMWCAFRWTWRSRAPIQIISTLMMLALFIGGVIDWLRLGGQTRFEGIYLSTFTYSGMLLAMGLLLLGRLAAALMQSQKMGALLERQVAERIAYEVTENIPVGTFTVVAGGMQSQPKFSFMSRRFLQITHLKQEELGGSMRNAFSKVHPDDLAELKPLILRAARTKKALSARFRLKLGQRTRWIHLESAPRDRADGSTVWEGVLIDETEQVLAREAAERDRAALQANLVAQSQLEERERLLRDVHDGFGSQLATVRMLVEKGRIPPEQLPSYLHEVSADLHLVVDTLGQMNITLAEAFHDMRHRIERRFRAKGMHFHWRLVLDGMPALSSRNILQILRIAQEAVHNAILHANALNISVEGEFDPARQQLTVCVRDDGAGMPEVARHGRGIGNMQHRAREVGGRLEVLPGHPGTVIRFELSTTDQRTLASALA
jgi:signal transduction histidine kinase